MLAVQQEQLERSVYLVQPELLALELLALLALSVFQEPQAFKAPQVLQAWMAQRVLQALSVFQGQLAPLVLSEFPELQEPQAPALLASQGQLAPQA